MLKLPFTAWSLIHVRSQLALSPSANACATPQIAQKSIASLGIEPVHESVRGGTDGAMLTYKGLPCPNLGTGDQNCHGRYEYVVVDEMEQASRLILRIAEMSTEVNK